MRISKRTFDLAFACLGLSLLLPVFVVISLLIKLYDGGPVLFRQVRVGYGGRIFSILKFRTMVQDAERLGSLITVGRDSRITPIGHWLRKWKLDELPQLINVVRGDMSLVGPRPEVALYVEKYTVDQRRVLELTPGITDPASIRYRNESELLAGTDDPEDVYVTRIMPEKIRLNLEYADRRSVWSDLLTILATILKLAD